MDTANVKVIVMRRKYESEDSSSSDDEWEFVLPKCKRKKRTLRPRIPNYGYIIDRFADYEFNSPFSMETEELEIERKTINDADVIESGRRIFDLHSLIQHLSKFGNHESVYGCSANNMKFVKEVRRRLSTDLHFKCDMCQSNEKISSDPNGNNNMDINANMVMLTFLDQNYL
ncbi:uncharacterized protein LOC116159570 [Photinus pyralis]|uniref:uncharacterized protein LOC116159570 n=1 Tax=Photinus pyralis TaxID=7054 RepID=UPI0012673772|nr:uncharacterized protein LOC116159570 [Photinus pyralis]